MVECPKDYKISRLIAKKLMGVILPEDEEKLNAWLEEDARNKDLYRRILETENLSVRDMYAKRLDVEHTWDTLRVQLVGQRKCIFVLADWSSCFRNIVCRNWIVLGILEKIGGRTSRDGGLRGDERSQSSFSDFPRE